MSSCCSISSCSHQLKSNEGKKASCVVFTYAVLCRITGHEESRVQVNPGVDPLSLKTTTEVSHPPIPSLPTPPQATQIRHAEFRFFFKLSGTSIFGGVAASHRQEGALRTQLQTQAPNKAVLNNKDVLFLGKHACGWLRRDLGGHYCTE